MRFLLIYLTLFLFGFDNNIKDMQDSFGYIKTYYSIYFNDDYECQACLMYPKDTEALESISKELSSTPYIKASGFVVKKTKNKTLIATSYHVCESLKDFTESENFKKLGDRLLKEAIENNFFINKEISKMYQIKPKISILEFDGTPHLINKIVFENLENDICFLESDDSWGKEIKFARKQCYYEKILNISASGGFYEPGSVAIREGYVNSTIKETEVEDRVFKKHLLYTLDVLPGASGSGVFNLKGELCGNINVSYHKIGVSFGASSQIIFSLYQSFLKTPEGSSYVSKE